MDAIDGISGVTFTYQWQRSAGAGFIPDETENIGAPLGTASTYRLVAEDLNKYIRVVVSFADASDNPEVLTSAAVGLASTDVCVRTPAVSAAILSAIASVDASVTDCVAVTSAQLAAIEGPLDLSGQNLSALQAIDFAGLTGLMELNLSNTSLSAVPDLSPLAALTTLDLSLNSLTTVLASSLPVSLTSLNLSGNSLTSVPDLSALTALTSLNLSGNDLTDTALASVAGTLPVSLTELNLSGNDLENFPSVAIARLTNLGEGLLDLSDNPSGAAIAFSVAYEIEVVSTGTSGGNATVTLRLGLPAYMPMQACEIEMRDSVSSQILILAYFLTPPL